MHSSKRRGQLAKAILAVSGSAFVLEGCDPTARDSVIAGVEGGTTSFLAGIITAFFDTIRANAEEDADATTVMADPIATDEPLRFA
ncbi:MAG: hypothetical protein ACKVS9_01985 [Phycisphaerae bacterium]